MEFIDPVVIFFLLGILASMARSGLHVPKDFYDTLSIYLLLAIGIKGGIDIVCVPLTTLLAPAIAVAFLSATITILAFFSLKSFGRMSRQDAVSIATHYGSVSVVTFAVATAYLQRIEVQFEEFSTVLLVFFEVMGIIAGISLSRISSMKGNSNIHTVLQEVFLGKGVLLLIGGIVIGSVTILSGNKQIYPFFIDLFKGFLALFMLEMGVITAKRLADLKQIGKFLILFGIGMPLVSAALAIIVGTFIGLSVGGITLLATMAASASYIAAPAAMKMAEPEANATLSMTAALGITFPFNIVLGIPLYYNCAAWSVGVFC